MPRKLVKLTEVSDKTLIPVNTLRYYRSIGIGPKMFRLGRGVVAYEDDVDTWIAEQAAKDAAAS
jgi:predicted DNA-binding transcriptional regulator AlpA